ncbi:Pleckstrin homology domain-containing protein [Aspergillus granulosus]|uniref:Pleckstrin homology domain-containing protein n=1 Tax=Aspergillus granulosus TaxID=176169 RepID=A0ABR4GVG3_9EURO
MLTKPLNRSLRFSKRFFYFHDEAIEAKQLSVYRANEKPAVANAVVAWASQTGKGLLFFTKRAEDKATPAGIISLADVTDITKDGANELHFKLSGHKHAFQASSAAERDSWIAALEAKSTEAKAEKETITSSESYKAELEKLTKPIVIEAPKKAAEPKEEAKEEEAKKEEEAPAAAAPAEETKDKDAKSRSRSRKRTSIFGTILGKKEAEEKKEEKEETKSEEAQPAAETPAPEAPVAETAPAAAAETTATETPAVAAAAPAEAEEKKEEEKKEETEPVAPTKTKRSSIFGNLFQKKEAAAPAEPAPVASTAPQLDNPVEEAAKPIEPETVTAAPQTEAAKETAPESPAAETPAAAAAAITKDKRRSSFFAFGKKKGDSDTETAEAETKPKGNKLGGLFRKPSKAVKPEAKETPAAEAETKAADKTEPVAEAAAAEEESSKPADAPATEEAKPVVASTSTPVQAAA